MIKSRYLTLATIGFLTFALGSRVWARLSVEQPGREFQGYWRGVDPVDGHVRYEPITKDLMLEHAALGNRDPVSTIVLHRVSGE